MSPTTPNLKKRVRTEAQLERKRARDRKSQRAVRERNKSRMEAIEFELSDLRNHHESLLNITERLANRHVQDANNYQSTHSQSTAETTDSLMGIQSSHSTSSTSNALSKIQVSATTVGIPLLYETTNNLGDPCTYPPITDRDELHTNSHLSDLSVTESNLPLISVDGGYDLSSWNIGHRLLNSAGLYQSLAQPASKPHTRVSEQAPAVDNVGYSPTWFTASEIRPASACPCLCPRQHEDGADCLERKIFDILFDAHMAMAANAQLAQTYPRSPSVANLLFIDLETNPIIQAVGGMLRKHSPITLADTMAVFFIMYRLLRVCAHLLSSDLVSW